MAKANHQGIAGRPDVTTRQQNAVQGVAPGQTATLELMMGVRYRALYLVYGGTTFSPALMDSVRVMANQMPIHNLTGTRRDTLNQFDGFPAASGKKVLTIPFYRAGARQYAQEWLTWINTGVRCAQAKQGITSLRLEVDIDAGASAPTLQVWAEICPNDAQQGASLLRAETCFENVANTGDYLHNHKYNKDPLRDSLTRMAFWDTDTNISSFYMLEDTAPLTQRTSLLNEQIQSLGKLKTTQSGVLVFDTMENGNDKCTIDIKKIEQLEVHTVHTATNTNLPVTYETLGTLGG